MSRRRLPRYARLAESYPTEMHPCEQGREREWNQCAIRLSTALEGAGFALRHYDDPTCRHGHARGAQSLGTYLWRQVGPPRRWAGGREAEARIAGRKGIVVFQDIEGFREGRGDHIDLWDGRALRTDALPHPETGAPVELRDPFGRATNVWFWELE